MGNTSGRTTSNWMATSEMPEFSRLTSNAHADVCIIGAGIAGLTTAYLLGQEGQRVVVLDHGSVGSGQTGRTTAHLVNVLDDRYFKLERLHGEKGARIAAESHTVAIDRIETIVLNEKIECEFERLDGYLFVPPGESNEVLKNELEALQKIGLIDVRLVDRAPLEAFLTGPCLRFPRQAQFHPLKYLTGMARAIARDGGRIFTHSHAEEIKGGPGAHVKVRGGFTVTTDHIVVATNTPVNDLVAVHTKQAAYRTYVIGASIPKGSVHKALYWDTPASTGYHLPEAYHYIRLQSVDKENDLLIVGGEDHKTGQADDAELRYRKLEEWTRARFPMVKGVDYRWSGQVMEPVDGVAYIGHNPLDKDNVYIITGDSGNGMTHGTIGGILITDLIMERENPWEDLYDPSRISLQALKNYASQNLNVAEQYTDWMKAGEYETAEEISPGSGGIIRCGIHKIAAYRDEHGQVHARSAKCSHLGCVVAWNSNEMSWDCPCHGSRFDRFGQVINGPAIYNLSEPPVSLPIEADSLTHH
jgi:glycine/D-amino acid oxidase-like deaminating enzyme/nitrite reductase/ring-hydroxylating ferredoxin subunit